MKQLVKETVNTVFGMAGLAVTRQETVERSTRSAVVERELVPFLAGLEDSLRETTMPNFPRNARRHELMIDAINYKLQTFHILNHLHETLSVPGAVWEMGTAYGATSSLIANEILDTDKHLWLFDSFQGLSKPTAKDLLIDDIAQFGTMESYEGSMAYTQDTVLSRVALSGISPSRVHVVAGFIEESAKTAKLPDQVSFAYVDFDLYEPILVGLRLLDKRLSPSGIILVDDYAHFSLGAKTAVDEFVAEKKGEFTLSLPPPSAGKFAILKRW